MSHKPYDIILIGGSAGSMDVIVSILQSLPAGFQTPVVLVVHRLKNTASKLDKILANKTGVGKVYEPEDKQPVQNGMVYLAPQNYHLLVEADLSFSLDYSQPVNYSRPSIDISFESFGQIYGRKLLAVLLSGANRDGAAGLRKLVSFGGTAIVQDPAGAAYPAMPKAAMETTPGAQILKPDQIVHYIADNA